MTWRAYLPGPTASYNVASNICQARWHPTTWRAMYARPDGILRRGEQCLPGPMASYDVANNIWQAIWYHMTWRVMAVRPRRNVEHCREAQVVLGVAAQVEFECKV